MKAIVYQKYGSPEVLELEEIDTPVVKDDQVLIKVHAASVNPLDWHRMRGEPYFMRTSEGLTKPKNTGLGADVAGVVEAVGRDVTQVQPGDEVFGDEHADARRVRRGLGRGRRAEAGQRHVRGSSVRARRGTHRAAGSPRQGSDSAGAEGSGERCGGGRGHICRADREVVRSGRDRRVQHEERRAGAVIGADHVIDYTREDFTRNGQRYDLILEAAGNRSLSDLRRVLTPDGTLVLVGAAKGRSGGRPILRLVRALLRGRFVSQTVVTYMAARNRDDLLFLRELMEAGKVTPVIDRRYPLSEVPDAIRYLEAGHARGKVVITV